MQYSDDSDQGFYPQNYEQFVNPQEPPTGTPGMTPNQSDIPTLKVPPGHQFSVQTGIIPQEGIFGIPWKWIAIGAIGYIALKHF